jgi:hypothetical protein
MINKRRETTPAAFMFDASEERLPPPCFHLKISDGSCCSKLPKRVISFGGSFSFFMLKLLGESLEQQFGWGAVATVS